MVSEIYIFGTPWVKTNGSGDSDNNDGRSMWQYGHNIYGDNIFGDLIGSRKTVA